ncbi:MAG: restriction endonuclease, partial [Spirulinaceae cyanobacterium]
FRWEAISPDQLEQLVYGIIESYQPYEIIRTSGPGGKGKDIIAKFRTTGHLKEEYDETYYIEVKHSEVNRQVSVDQIQAALSWVLVNKPNCFVMAVSSQLSSTTRD